MNQTAPSSAHWWGSRAGKPSQGPRQFRKVAGKGVAGTPPRAGAAVRPPHPDLAAPMAWILRISGPACRRLQILA